jgi:23S rRNA pseudouridine955/2504/2580 synthase
MNIKAFLPNTVKRWVVTPEEATVRLVDFLRLKDPSSSATAWRKQIDAQSIWVNASPARLANRQLDAFDVVLHSPFEETPWAVLSKESEFWVLDKPAGASYESGRDFLRQQGHNPFPVHRLDAMTTGLLIMAQTQEAQEYFEALFRGRNMRKQYLAVVWGEPKTKSGTISARLVESASRHGGVHVRVSDEKGRGDEAVTDWTCLGTYQGISFLKCEPKTGRTHQIRAHLSHAGFPVIGDRDYLPEKAPRGLRGNIFANQHLLHAYELSFEWKGFLRSWRAPLRGDMKRFAQMLQIEQIELM